MDYAPSTSSSGPPEDEVRRPRVAFFSSYWTKGDAIDLGGSDYWRLAVPATQLYTHGWDVVLGRCVASAKDGTLQVQDPAGNWHDDREIIVWQRWMGKDTADALRHARAVGQIVINDVDDHYWGLPRQHIARNGTDPLLHPLYNREHYRETLKASSLITVSTPYLEHELRQWGETRLIRNFIDLDAWPPRLPGDHVGWIGAVPWRGSDLEMLRETVVPWLRERGRFFYHGGHTADSTPVAEILNYDRITTRPMVPLNDYPHLWDPLRVALIPIEDSPFGRAKSYVKGLEAAARGIPFIASPHAEYYELGLGLVAEKPSDWTRHLEALEDPEFYAAEAARNRTGAEAFSIQKNWGRWADLLSEARNLEERSAEFSSKPRGRSVARSLTVDVDDATSHRLAELPSATTISERVLTFNYVTSIWDGTGDVFENGPLLGGATRALALGMLRNERQSPTARLYTYDWWNARVPLDVSPGTFEDLASRSGAVAAAVREMGATGSFRPVFRSLLDSDYAELVADRVGYLPGHRGDVAKDDAVSFSLSGRERPFSFLFIDGCKSWYGTKYWLRKIAPFVEPGAHFLFQDFGQYTCFWLPMLMGCLCDCFTMTAYVDYTYGFRLTQPLTPELVEERFPDEPTDLDRSVFDDVFDGLMAAAEGRSDQFARGALAAQRAAAYTYLGLADEARKILDDALENVDFVFMRNYLLQARKSPTYTPEGALSL